jgi:hypothetical protein
MDSREVVAGNGEFYFREFLKNFGISEFVNMVYDVFNEVFYFSFG